MPLADPFTYPCTTGNTSPLLKTGVEFGVLTSERDIQRKWDQTSSTTTLICAVKWEDTSDFVEDMLGYSEILGTGGASGADLSRVLPEYNPYNPAQYAMSCELIQQTGYDSDSTGNFEGFPEFPGLPTKTPGISHFRVTYAAPLYHLLEDEEVTVEHQRYCVITPKGVAENERIPGGAFKTVDADMDSIPETSIKTGRAIDLEVKWLDVPFLNYTKIASLSNKVNSASWTIGDFTFPAEAAMFKTWSATPRVNAFGNYAYDLTLTFACRQDTRTWNMFWKRNGTFVEVSSDGTSGGTKVFTAADLDGIFSMQS